MNKGKTRILVYRNQPLPVSEVFVYNQSFRLERYEANFLGAKYPPGPRIELPADQVYLINRGGKAGLVREALFKFFGYIPRDVLQWVERMRPQLIHAYFAPDGAMMIPLAKKLKLPLVVSFLGTDVTLKDKYALRSYWGQRLYLLRRSRLAREVARVVTPSVYLKQRVLEHGFLELNIRTIRHGVDLEVFAHSIQNPEWGQILYVGRLVPVKGLSYLIEAVSQVRRRFPQVRLSVIGDGPMRATYEEQAKKQLRNGYVFLGAQPHAIVLDHMARAYLFSMPSITMPTGQAEAFGLVFAEAQAMGVPVISFASGAIPEVVLHGETGFLAREGDVGEMASYIVRLLENPDVRARMGEKARAWGEKMFDLKKQNAELEVLYDEVLNERNVHGAA
jgi:colanic acid/amylovoran biosynthesis glycosyltransferase